MPGARIRLGFNCDHVATLRQARKEGFPDPVEASRNALAAGADQITAHLREDRRHIQESDLHRLRECGAPINLEMALAEEIVRFAEELRPHSACLVPERREELTTEGGLDVRGEEARIAAVADRLRKKGVRVSLFVDPETAQIEAAHRVGADAVELHTGPYARAFVSGDFEDELARLVRAAEAVRKVGLSLHAGHGLDRVNLSSVLSLPGLVEVNIGFSIVARAVFVGLEAAIREIRRSLDA